VHTDVTAVFPWLTHALLLLKNTRRKPFRLMEKMDDAMKFLDAAVEKNRGQLMETIEWDVSEAR
jgi:deoxyhypusine synthase